ARVTVGVVGSARIQVWSEDLAVALHADLEPPAVQLDEVAAELVDERGVEPEDEGVLDAVHEAAERAARGEVAEAGRDRVEHRGPGPVDVLPGLVPADRL